jgi:NTP pyrophosphatase (non-canonical NTP hydrolase)
MKFEQYHKLALRTAKDMGSAELNLWHAGVGLMTEVGELLDAYKRAIIYGKELDKVNALEEIGDMMWYLNLWIHHHGIDFSTVTARDLADVGDDLKPQATRDYVKAYPQIALTMNLTAAVYCLFTVPIDVARVNSLDTGTIAQQARRLATATAGYTFALLGQVAQDLGGTVEACMEANIAKLAKRYGDKYTDLAAINRDTTAERGILNATLS